MALANKKPAPKLAAPKGKSASAKPGKLKAPTKGGKPAKAKVEKVKAAPILKNGTVGEFLAYQNNRTETPMFEKGERIVVVGHEKDADKNVHYTCIKEGDYAAYKQNAEDENVNGDQLFAAEFKVLENEKVDEYALTVPDTERLTELLAENENDALATAKALIESANESYFYLGGCLAKLYAGQTFRDAGEKGAYNDEIGKDKEPVKGTGWDKFCRENFDMGGRKALGLISIYRSFSVLPDIDLDEISRNPKIGWVKLEQMATVVKPDNVAELLEQAQENNVEDFRALIKSDYQAVGRGAAQAGGASAKIKRTSFGFKLFEDAGAAVQFIIAQAQKQYGYGDDANMAFEHIMTEWANDHLSETAAKKVLTERRRVIKELGDQGVDVANRKQAMADLTARIEGQQAAA